MSVLTADRLKILRRKLKEKGIAAEGGTEIRRGISQAPTAASYSQQRLWFLHQLDPQSPAYNIPVHLRLRGPLEESALVRSLDEIVQRHDSLRTRFEAIRGEPFQVVRRSLRLQTPSIDLSGLPAWRRPGALERIARNWASRPFDLTQAPLIRTGLVKTDAQEHALLMCLHHSVADGWSINLILREAAALYNAFSRGLPSPLPQLPIQYGDFAVWQRDWLLGEEAGRQLNYWKGRLSGGIRGLELPFDRPRRQSPSDRGQEHRFRIGSQLTSDLKAVSDSLGCTLFMTLTAGYQLLLHRYCAQDSIAIGTSTAGRGRPETEELIGCFLNSLVLIADFDSVATPQELLLQVRQTALEASENQDIPVEKLIEELQPARSRSANPLFQTLFVFQNLPIEALHLRELELKAVPVETGAAKFDLLLNLEQDQAGLAGHMQYNSELFDAGTIERLTAHLERLLQGMADAPKGRLTDIPLLTREERLQAIADSGDALAEGPALDLMERLSRQARSRPEAAALRFHDRVLSYGQLESRSNQLARYLRRLGLGADSLAGILMDRSPEVIVALAATLKAGGAYLPLDPTHPRERIESILEDARPRLVLTRADLAGLLPDGQERLALDEEGSRIASLSDDPVESSAAPTNLAYLIYTSGSTGKPKGVAVSRGSLANYASSFAREHSIAPGDCMLQFASLSFDTSAEEIFPALVSGASLALRTDSMISTVPRFLQHCREWKVTLLDLPTAYWHQVAESLDSENTSIPDSIRLVIIGGERALPERLRAWRRRVGANVRLVNTYGPTEACIVATRCDVTADQDSWTSRLPIGEAIENARAYVLDRGLQPCPPGAAGELCIAGAGVARGYLRRPAATAERFIPDPFAGRPGARMYRSGDLARRLPSGQLEFRGRVDHQVKVRGFRIELAEIEAALSLHPQIAQAAVAAWDAGSGDRRLAAYVAPKADSRIERSKLRRFLASCLPDYMLPSTFSVLDQLPLTAGGKVDRRALPRPEPGQAESWREYLAPRTPIEEMMAGVWSDLLGVERVGVEDDFFELGGHSLLATQAIARLREATGIEIPLEDFFRAPNIASLAERTEAAGEAEQAAPLPAMRKAVRDRQLPLSFSQERLWFLQQLDPGNRSYYVSRAIRFSGDLALDLLERTLTELVRRHEVLRTAFPSFEGKPWQAISRAEPVSLPLFDLGGLAEERAEVEARRLIVALGQTPFDVAHGPLLRLTLLRLGQGEHILALVEHHLLHDGWTQGVLIREFAEIFAALRQGLPSPLPDLEYQFADFAAWQRKWMQGDALRKQLSYWRGRLAGAPELLQLPADFTRPAVMRFRGRELRLVLEGETADGLRRLSRRLGATLFMTALAAFKSLLARWTGSQDIVVGTAIANRRWHHSEALAGMIINNLVLRTDLSGDPDFPQLLGRVRETTLGAYAHQDVPFEKLVEELSPQRSLAYTPLFQVQFAFMDVPVTSVELPGLRIRGMDAHNRSSKFDLSVITVPPAEQAAGRSRERSQISIFFEYNSEVFEKGTIQRLMEHYRVTLEALAGDRDWSRPDRPVSQLPLLGADELSRMRSWNRTAAPFPQEQRIQDLLQSQADADPQREAVSFAGETWTYGELSRRSDSLARHLRHLGAGPEVRVGICLGRSIDAIAAVWGVLKAGACYLPIDPAYPSERLKLVLEDAQAKLLVCNREIARSLPDNDSQIVLLDDLPEDAATADDAPLQGARPENAAYAIYTSGSTGRPKAVVVTQRNLVHSTRARLTEYAHRPQRYLLLPSLAFDSSVAGLFWTLVSGGKLVLPPDGYQYDIAGLSNLMQQERVTHLLCLPSLYQLILEQASDSALAHLRSVIVAGEACPGELPLGHRKRASHADLFNEYGPTEGTVWCSLYRSHPDERRRTTLPIGKPIANAQLYILDRHLQSVPIGVPGRLFIAGQGVARGYLRRSAATARRFLPDPLCTQTGARMYDSGDMARWLPSGNIEFLGRADHQVKIRGYRVEPGEIEAVLRSLPGVREAVVIARPRPSGVHQLVAYWTGEAEIKTPLTRSDLRAFLRRRLPDYMTPAFLVEIDRIPLGPNGKIDRKALPEPGSGEQAEGLDEPRTETEKIVAGIWGELLGRSRVGLGENFFELGGHSLMVARILARLTRVFGVDIPIRTVFESPTVEGLSRAVEAMRREGSSTTAPALRHQEGIDQAPLSFAQLRIWFLEQMGGAGGAYHISAAQRIRGDLDAAALQRSLQEIVNRHSSLRTGFVNRRGEPLQIVSSRTALLLAIQDLQGIDDPDRLIEDEARRERVRPFDLTRPPLLRARLLRLGRADHALLLTMHHLVSDGWSMGLLVGEMGSLYAAYTRRRPPSLPRPHLDYADFALWQRKWLQDEELNRHIQYWRNALGEADSPLELPIDRSRPAVQSFRGAVERFELGEELSRKAEGLGRRLGVTLFMTLMAAFGLLIHRLTGSRDIRMGVPTAGRRRPELEGMIGLFVNTVVMRCRISGQESFAELLEQVRETSLEDLDHQDMPFERLVEELSPVRDTSRSALFQIMFALQNAPSGSIEAAGLEISPIPMQSRRSAFDLSLFIHPEPAGLIAALEYSSSLFDPDSAARMASCYRRLLASAVADTQAPVGDLTLLGETERRLLLEDWNRTQRSYPQRSCIHQLIEEQALRSPSAVAIECGERRISYDELESRANRLAHFLRRQGLASGKRAGVCLGRSEEMVIALLAVLKTGAAYIPLDPTYPHSRLLFMLDDSQAELLVTDTQSSAELSAGYPGRRVRIDAQQQAISACSEAALDLELDSRLPAYLIYTSGTSGIPKGVAVSHQSLVNVCDFAAERYRLGPGERSLQFASFSFDVAGEEIYAPLLRGAAVVLRNDAMLASSQGFLRALERLRITWLNLPSAFWHRLVEDLEGSSLPLPSGLRLVVVGGEKVSLQHLAAWGRLTATRPIPLFNAYGPTETAIDASVHEAKLDEVRRERLMLAVGGPIANTRIHLLDRRLQLTALGAAGEVCIAGDGVSSGYWRRPRLTAERFIPDPFAVAPGQRLYRSGDLGRRLPGGEIDLLGRIDDQIKIRGYRVEPGEIEHALEGHPHVLKCFVKAWEEGPGTSGLAAYVIGEAEADESEWRSFLRKRLPEHMVPSSFQRLEKTPLTPAGKIDYSALPQPCKERESASGFVPPEGEAERIVAAIWQQELGVDSVGAQENFFDLGGHSLLLIRVQARLAEEFGKEIAALDLFRRTTVRSLARFLSDEDEDDSSGRSTESAFRRGGERRTAVGRRRPRRRADAPGLE